MVRNVEAAKVEASSISLKTSAKAMAYIFSGTGGLNSWLEQSL